MKQLFVVLGVAVGISVAAVDQGPVAFWPADEVRAVVILILITQHGVPSAYLVDVESYDALQRRVAVLEGIARGERAIDQGRVVTHAKARARMARWLK